MLPLVQLDLAEKSVHSKCLNQLKQIPLGTKPISSHLVLLIASDTLAFPAQATAESLPKEAAKELSIPISERLSIAQSILSGLDGVCLIAPVIELFACVGCFVQSVKVFSPVEVSEHGSVSVEG